MDEAARRRLTAIEKERAAIAKRDAELAEMEEWILAEALRQIRANPSERVKRRLRKLGKGATLATMATEPAVDTAKQQTRSARVSRARIAGEHRKHPFVDALVERGLTVTEAAEAIGYGRSTVQSWYATGDNGRPIPRDAAVKIEARYGVPVTAWRRITD